jgi:ribosomal protein L37AE/L43A
MYDLEEYRCPFCNSTDVARIETKAIYDELMECRSCKEIYPIEYVRGAAQASAGLIEGPRQLKRSHPSSL